jgi:hypothetical protein
MLLFRVVDFNIKILRLLIALLTPLKTKFEKEITSNFMEVGNEKWKYEGRFEIMNVFYGNKEIKDIKINHKGDKAEEVYNQVWDDIDKWEKYWSFWNK